MTTLNHSIKKQPYLLILAANRDAAVNLCNLLWVQTQKPIKVNPCMGA